MISANNVSLEGVDYATAVQVLRDSGQTVSLVVKRRVVLPPTVPPPQTTSAISQNQLPLAADKSQDQNIRVALARSKKKEDFGVVLGCKIYIKEITGRSVADKDGILEEGDLVSKINNTSLDGLTLKEARKIIETSKDKLELVVQKPGQQPKHGPTKHGKHRSSGGAQDGEYGMSKHNYAAQNLYVQPPISASLGQSPAGAGNVDEKNNLARATAVASTTNTGIYATRGDVGVPTTTALDMNIGGGSPSEIDSAVPPRPPLPGAGQNEGKPCMHL